MKLQFLMREYEFKNHFAHFDKDGPAKHEITIPIVLLPYSSLNDVMYDPQRLYFTTKIEYGDEYFVIYRIKKL